MKEFNNPTIWKEELSILPIQSIVVPHGAKLLCVKMQLGIPYVWFMFNYNYHKTLDKIFKIYFVPTEMQTF